MTTKEDVMQVAEKVLHLGDKVRTNPSEFSDTFRSLVEYLVETTLVLMIEINAFDERTEQEILEKLNNKLNLDFYTDLLNNKISS